MNANAQKKNEGKDIPIDIVETGDHGVGKSNEQAENTNLEKLQRLQAEFVNYRRRTEKEKESLADYVKGDLITRLLPVLDDLDLLSQHAENEKCPVEAIQLIIQKMKKILYDEGLETIDAVTHPFDPDIHEALAVEHVNDPDQEGLVVEEWQKGYRFRGNLLRPSRVKVAKIKKDNESE
jgi:molecular chaperone GrpE